MSYWGAVGLLDREVLTHLGGVPVIYAPSTGAPVTVTGIFDERFVLSDPGHAGLEQVAPVVSLILSDLPSDPVTDDPTLTIAGKDYEVRGRETDTSAGSVMLLLRLVGM